ncbi:MAG: sulfatase-like hydrolase/transferase [Planctomycetota bacterium]
MSLRSFAVHQSLVNTEGCVSLAAMLKSFQIAIGICLLVPASVTSAPNVILVMCDDLGWGDVGFNGGQLIATPHLDAWAADSLIFRRFYAAAPVCSPTRGSCLTGRHPHRLGIPHANQGHLRREELTLGEVLQQAGYRTGHFGKWHLGTLTRTVSDSNRGGNPKQTQHFSPPQWHGFEVCFSTEARVPTYDPMLRPPPRDARPPDSWDALDDRATGIPFGTHYWNERGEIVEDNLHGDDSRVIMDRAIPFIEQSVASNEPFLAVIWFHSPHLPVVAGADHRAAYPAASRPWHQNYYGCVTALDEQMGRLRATLRQLNVAANTLLWFCADNGPEGGPQAPGATGPFRGRKRSLYEGGIRVPAFAHWPRRIPAGRSTDFPAVTSDYLPTILEFLGESGDEHRPLDGVSLLSVLSDTVPARSDPIGFLFRSKGAWIADQYKLVGDTSADQWELYDLQADPGEQTDLAQSEPRILRRMRDEFEAWRASCEPNPAGDKRQGQDGS